MMKVKVLERRDLMGQPALIVDVDVECLGCGYNLKTLSWTANCPECGRRVEDSRVLLSWPYSSQMVRRLQLFLKIFLLGVILRTLAWSQMSIACLYAMQILRSPYRQMFRWATFFWIYGELIGGVIIGISLILATTGYEAKRRPRRAYCRVTQLAASASVLSAALSLTSFRKLIEAMLPPGKVN